MSHFSSNGAEWCSETIKVAGGFAGFIQSETPGERWSSQMLNKLDEGKIVLQTKI